jgi:CRISPR-associated endonuclease Csn1
MFIKEFDRIWEVQSKYHKELTPELYKKLRKAIFFQRPLRSSKGLVGKCSIVKNKRRLIAAHPLAQEVRMLQFVNNVRVCEPGKVDRQLNPQEREAAISKLTESEKLTIKQFRDCAGLPKKAKLNFENDDDTHAYGMGTTSSFRAILGDGWDKLNPISQEKLIHDVISFNKRDALIRHLIQRWQFDQDQAIALSDLNLEPGYASHSRVALEAIRGLLANPDNSTGVWLTYSEAKQKAFPDAKSSQSYPVLPPVRDVISNITNPSVIRALTEVRKVVNELIGRYGIPSVIRIELARELKKSKKERKKIEDLIREQTKKRRSALSRIREEITGYPEKVGYDRGIEMILLAEECNWQCPYTGEQITSVKDLMGDNSRFDIEHIFPRRYLDDSFSNKTLCLNHENRNVKKDQLPAIAYQSNPERFEEIIGRVRRFKGVAASRKLERFLATEVPSDFVSRQLDETRYMSRAAADYLGLLYGGRIDDAGKQRVFTITGGLTAILRGQWKLNQILGLVDEKNRADHRHHAVDSIVIACTDMSIVQALQSAASQGWNLGGTRRYPQIDPPFAELLEESRRSILQVVVSHRPNRKLNGPLHADTLYSVKKNAAGKYDSKIRKPLKDLTEMQIDRIVDETVKKIVQAKYRQLLAVNKPPKKAGDLFASVENHPFIENADGSCTPIHSVRIWEYTNADKPQQKQITTKGGTRFLSSIGGSNYCSRFYSILDPRGQEIGWRDRVLSRLEAMKLFGKGKSKKKVVLQEIDESTSTAGLGAQEFDENLFVFDLFIHDFILMNNKQQVPTLFRVMSLSSGDIEVRVHTDGRRSDAVKKSGDRVRIGAKSILRRGFRKVFISPAGMLVDAITGEILEKTCFVD